MSVKKDVKNFDDYNVLKTGKRYATRETQLKKPTQTLHCSKE